MIATFFSVCIPTYNAAHLLEEAIASVLAQTFADFELVIQDDCSTDKTFQVVNQFSDPRISYQINDSNLGIFGNLNAVCARAEGRYLKILCNDDTLSPWCLETIHDQLEQSSYNCKLVSVRETECRELTERQPEFDESQITWLRRESFFEFLSIPDNWGAGLAELCVEREFFAERGFFGIYDKTRDYSLDILTWFRMVLCTEAMLIDVPLVFQRPHSNQARYHLPRINQLHEMLDFFVGQRETLQDLPGYWRGHRRYLDHCVVSHLWQGFQTWRRGNGIGYLKNVYQLMRPYRYKSLPVHALFYKVSSRLGSWRKPRWELK